MKTYKEVLSILLFLVISCPIVAGTNEDATRLVGLLREMGPRQEVTPDSFYTDVKKLDRLINQETDPTAKAIYQASMAHLLAINSGRATAYERKTPSPKDSIQEWSQEEYKRFAAEYYALAFQDLELLHAAKTRQWLPLVNRGRNENIFDGDMLHVVCRTMENDIPENLREKYNFPKYSELITLYEKRGNREAGLRLLLDSLTNRPHADNRKTLLRLKDDYKELPACAEVYLALSDMASEEFAEMPYNDSIQNQIKKKQEEWLLKGLQLYPNYSQKGMLENRLKALQCPSLSWEMHQMYLPNTDATLPISGSNIQEVCFTVYRLPNNFQTDSYQETDIQTIRKQGKQIAQYRKTFPTHPAIEKWRDTLSWKTPSYGKYALIGEAKTKCRFAKIKSTAQIFSISSMDCFFHNLPDGRQRIVVVDAQDGRPLEGVKVTLQEPNGRKPMEPLFTDKYGRVSTAILSRQNVTISLSKGADSAYARQNLTYFSPFTKPAEPDTSFSMNVFTDRSIYRPGQTVYASALYYKYKDWDAHVVQGRDFTITLLDTNYQTVETHTRSTDEFGMLTDSFNLPEKCLPGNYMLRVGNAYCTIRVEEYRRPTFEVEMDKVKELKIPTDSITLSGRAVTYSGVPVSRARVTGTYIWRKGRFWRLNPHFREVEGQIDTLYTDSEGRFRIRIPMIKESEELKSGVSLNMSVDVLSNSGETQQGNMYMELCSERFRLQGTVLRMQDKERVKPWTIHLYSSTGQKLEGDVQCRIKGTQGDYSFTMPAGKPFTPEILQSVPSGRYRLTASYTQDGDSARMEQDITLFSMEDKKPVVDTVLWTYFPTDTFDVHAPARIQLGTSLNEGWLHCTLISEKSRQTTDTIIHLSDSLICYEVSYLPSYGKGALLTVNLYHAGQLHSSSIRLHLRQPDTRLKAHWDTFRDHLRPGQQEEWALNLKKTDGTPARANVLLRMYDASLDALYPMNQRLHVYKSYYMPYLYVRCNRLYSSQDNTYLHIDVPENWVRALQYSYVNESLFPRAFKRQLAFVGRAQKEVAGSSKIRKTKKSKRQDTLEAVEEAEEYDDENRIFNCLETGAPTSAPKMAGGARPEVLYEEETAEETEVPISPDMLREDLQELAFFRPTLRTDAQGHVRIAFTLPESLTSWHLSGFAHTQDLMNTSINETIVAQKEIMAELYLPRFIRKGDRCMLSASIRNISDEPQSGTATLQLLDAETEKVIKTARLNFSLNEKQDTAYSIPCSGNVDTDVLIVRWLAKADACSDGEQRLLPILSAEQQITETKTFMLQEPGKTEVNLDKLFGKGSKKATDRSLTIEYVARPVWLALQSLPSLSEPIHRDVISLTSAFYSGSLAQYIAKNIPGMKQAVDEWNQAEDKTQRPMSWNNQDVTGVFLQETPWVLDAQRSAQRNERLGSLFNEQEQEQRRMELLNAIGTLQHPDGSLAWYPGMAGSPYLTVAVATLMARLNLMTGTNTADAATSRSIEMTRKMMEFLAGDVAKEIKRLKKAKEKDLYLTHTGLSYLYCFYTLGIKSDKVTVEDVNFMLGVLKKEAPQREKADRALAAIVLHRSGAKKEAKALMPKLRTQLKQADGFYLAYPGGGFTSIDRKIQNHVQLMEAWALIEPQDHECIRGMQQWLLQQKRTQEWEQPIQTADAVFALMQTTDFKTPAHNTPDELQWTDGNKSQTISTPESQLGYVQTTVRPVKNPKVLTVQKNGSGLSWGSVYAKYRMPITETEAQQEGLNIRRELAEDTKRGERIHVRYVITADRDYEYVRIYTPRSGGTEPDSQLSGYRWKDGLGYYCAIHDSGNEYFVDRLPRGTYVIEEDWLTSHAGSFKLAPAVIQCLYAPEFQAHTAGCTLDIKP